MLGFRGVGFEALAPDSNLMIMVRYLSEVLLVLTFA